MGKLTSSDIEARAIALVRKERNEWNTATAFVTERVAFQMKNLLRQLRKNYWGIFDKPTDPTTGREKTWVPLSEHVTETAVKNIDLDQKDINFRAKKRESLGLVPIVRNVVKHKLDEMFFGEKLDELERTMAIDGTAVWKILPTTNEDGDASFKIIPVDNLNFYIDPTAHSIQEAGACIERALLSYDQFMAMDGWDNKDEVLPRSDLPRLDRLGQYVQAQVPQVEIFERWGLMPKSLITADSDDDKLLVEGHIVVSNLDRAPFCHLVELNDETDEQGMSLRPYEEAWYTRVPGRWYGKGTVEKVMMLQLWLNTIVNIRINRSFVSQLGLFKIRKGSGITPQILSRLAANGAITVSTMDDIEQMAVQEASQASYTDEENIMGWAERLTSAFESVSGESMPASTPATNAVLQARAASSQFGMVKESIGMFLQRVMKRHILPKLFANLDKDEIVRITGEANDLKEWDTRIANQLLFDEISQMNKKGIIGLQPEWVEREKQKILSSLAGSGEERYVKLQDELDVSDYDVEVFITNEEIDKAVTVQNLIAMLQTVASVPGTGIDPVAIATQIMDLMGLDSNFLSTNKTAAPAGAPGVQIPGATLPPTNQKVPMSMLGNATAAPTDQTITTQANTSTSNAPVAA